MTIGRVTTSQIWSSSNSNIQSAKARLSQLSAQSSSGLAVSKPSDVTAALSDAKKDGHKAVLLRVKTGDNVRYVALAPSNAG